MGRGKIGKSGLREGKEGGTVLGYNNKMSVKKNRFRLNLLTIYDCLFTAYGPQHWWPGETPFEVMVGAILTQSAAWRNVEQAITNLKQAGDLSPAALRDLPHPELASLIRPSGYYNAKTKKLKALASWLAQYSDNLVNIFSNNTKELRLELLGVHGIGPETADSILLYAAGKPVFVIDAYTRRIFQRLGILLPDDSYDVCQALFTRNLVREALLYNEYHALLVKLGKDVCRKKPDCDECCLGELCRYKKLAH
jgi:endonuclease-3 related protein